MYYTLYINSETMKVEFHIFKSLHKLKLVEELFDRFGPPPVEVNNLLQTLIIKNKCLKNNISFIDAGPKGILLGFKNNFFKNLAIFS